MSQIPLEQGRRTFGEDPVGYARARPEYPDELYKRLTERCNLNSGSVVFEVGPGTGLATRQLLKLAVAALYAIEPDPRLVAFLRQNISCSALRIEESSFEDTNLPAAFFDLGIAATSFHWVEQGAGLSKVRQALRPGGWWAMWWNHFGGDKQDDAFQSATDHLFINMPDSPSLGREGRPPFALDQDARLHDLLAAGFENPQVDLWPGNLQLKTPRLLDLYRTFSPVQALDATHRDVSTRPRVHRG